MRSQERATARKQLDKRLQTLRPLEGFARPPRGWVKAIREALGMTSAQLAKRVGVSQPRVMAIEKAEVNGSITLASLEQAAHALNCQFIYALIPRNSLEVTIEQRAMDLADRKIKSTAHSMALEAQSVGATEQQEQILMLRKKLVEKSGSQLWDYP